MMNIEGAIVTANALHTRNRRKNASMPTVKIDINAGMKQTGR